MAVFTQLLIAAVAAAPTVDVVTLSGKKHAGTLEAITAKSAKVNVGGKSTTLPLAELMHVAFPKTAKAKPSKTGVRVTLTDGTSLLCKQVTGNGRTATLESAAFGKLEVPFGSLARIRLVPPSGDPKKEKQWTELIAKKASKDYLVTNKPKTLDFLSVVVDSISEEKVKFAFAGMTPELERTRFFGIIFARKSVTPASKIVCNIELAGGDQVQVSKIGFDGGAIKATLLTGSDVQLATDKIAKLDFSLGKIKYLSDMEPSEVDVKPFFPDPFVAKLFQYRRNHTNTGKPLKLGKTTYERGLWIHSRTELKYRLAGDYRQFKAIMGIDQAVAENGKGHVRVVITGDDKKLLETTVRAGDQPIPLNLDVSKVINLTILVDYGENQDTSDHLNLCEARVIK